MLYGGGGEQEVISCVVEHWLHALADGAREATSSHVAACSQGTRAQYVRLSVRSGVHDFSVIIPVSNGSVWQGRHWRQTGLIISNFIRADKCLS